MACPLGQIGMRSERTPTIKALVAFYKSASRGQRTRQNQEQKDKDGAIYIMYYVQLRLLICVFDFSFK